ncbi:class I SAM-dependent methyltransferase [Candidatus Microgenomates bacterium]|nr:MAG: class I SAM-dependent methyltransferase [Candidatus Microgenomates bacterium]
MDKIGGETLDVMSYAKNYNGQILKLLAPYLQGDILEVGCGKGTFTKELALYGRVVAVDNNKQYLKKIKILANRGVRIGYGDIEKNIFFFKHRKFDVIVNLNVLEHVKNDNKALKNMYNLLNTKGVLLLLTPAHQVNYTVIDKGLGHFRRYSKKELSAKFESVGFRIQKAHYYNWVGAIGWFVAGRILKKKIVPINQLNLFDKVCAVVLHAERVVRPPFGLSVFIVGEKR